MRYLYSGWDGSQEIPPLDSDEVLDLLTDDLFEYGDLQRALERLMMRGGQRPQGDRLDGLRDLLDRLRQRRQDQMHQHNLNSPLADIADKLKDIVEQERQGIEQRLEQSRANADAPPDMQKLLEQLADRKQQTLDQLPEDAGGMLQQLMDYEFMTDAARDAFNQLVEELRQQMLQQYFQGLQQGLEGMTPEDLAPLREMVKELNKLLQKQLSGEATQQDVEEFMQRFGQFFPEGMESIDDLVEYMRKQAAQMASLMKSMSPEQRQQLQQTIEALLRDDRLAWDLAQLAGMLEQLTGQPLGQPFPFDGQSSLPLDQALEMMRQMQGYEDLERQLQEAIREFNPERVDPQLMQDLLGPEAKSILGELQRLTQMLEDEGLIKRGGRDMTLTSKAVRRIGERALKDIFAELRTDRAGQHDVREKGRSSEQEHETKAWEFGDPFFVDIAKSISNAVYRSGAGTPVQITVKDLEVYKTEALTTASTVIVLDMSMSMIRSGAFAEGKRVALALDTLMRSKFPRDYLELVVFSFFAMELKPERLLESDWARYPRGTNIQEGLRRARKLLSKHKSSNRQIILITDGQPTMYTDDYGQVVRGWSPYEWPRYSPEAMQETLKEVKRCTRDAITINTFMMASDPALVTFTKLMSQINKGRAFLTAPGHLGHYLLVDYLKGKTKTI